MKLSDKICEEVKNLPEPLQVEVLDYVHFLAPKIERQGASDEQDSKYLSLSLAMRGMEDETSPDYFIDDLKEKFRL